MSLFVFEALFYWWRRSAKKKIKAKEKLQIHVVLGALAVLLSLLHGLIAGHLLFENLLALLALLLLILTAISGALLRRFKGKKLKHLHVGFCIATALLIVLHIPTALVQLF